MSFRVVILLSAAWAVRSQIPICTIDESLVSIGGALSCAAVDCTDKYGPARSYFNPNTKVCAAPLSSPSATPAASRVPGTSPSPRVSSGAGSSTSSTNGTTSGISSIICVHGAVVCGAATCACRCEEGWQTTTGTSGVAPSSSSPSSGGNQALSGTVWCNQSSTGLITIGQLATVPCYNSVQCFFVDQLPYALVS